MTMALLNHPGNNMLLTWYVNYFYNFKSKIARNPRKKDNVIKAESSPSCASTKSYSAPRYNRAATPKAIISTIQICGSELVIAAPAKAPIGIMMAMTTINNMLCENVTK